ncbi:MAG: hypothetical protein Q4E10_03910 [Porphyromonas sp.]|nr:hypothetical protein [Porphyromonas sp.]
MRLFSTKHISATIALLMMLGTSACRDTMFDRTPPMPELPDDEEIIVDDFEGGVEVTIPFAAHTLTTPATRAAGTALTVDQESELQLTRTMVMVFDKNGGWLYQAPLTKITRDPNKKQEGTLTVLLKPGVEQNIVVYSNVDEGYVKGTWVVGETKRSTLMNYIRFTHSPSNPVDFATDGIPMWGELKNVSIPAEGVPTISKLHLLRSVARIDVGLGMTAKGTAGTDADFDEEATTGFESDIVDAGTLAKTTMVWSLQEVKVYNAQSQNILVAPKEGHYTTSTDGKHKATKVSLMDPTLEVTTPPFTYTAEDNLLKRVIYVGETDNPNPTATQNGEETTPETPAMDYLKRPYLIVKLGYKPKGSPDGTQEQYTYFRIDFLKRDGTEATAKYTYLPLLRNYRYKVDIRNIGGLGFDNEEDAKQGPAANIMYNVLVWNESEMSDVVYDGQYMLGVKQDNFTFYRDGGRITTKMRTSWPKGFTIENLPTWITTCTIEPSDPGKTGSTDEKTVTFTVDEEALIDRTYPEKKEDAQNAEKAAYVEAGRMKWFLSFEQFSEYKLEIDLFLDADCTKPVQFLEINQYGEAYDHTNPDKSILDNSYNRLSAEDAGAYYYVYARGTPHTLIPEWSSNFDNPFKITYIEQLSTGVRKYKVTAPDITEDGVSFDRFSASWQVSITDPKNGNKASAQLGLIQQECNAVPYFEEELQNIIYDDEDASLYIMDGTEQHFYVKANTPYNIRLVSAISDNGVGNVVENSGFTHDTERNYTLSGKPVPFTPVNDLVDPKLFNGWAVFEISSPHNYFSTRQFKVHIVSGIKQPEANTYMIKKGVNLGILIPVSRVNTAYDYHYQLLMQDATSYPYGGKYGLPLHYQNFLLNKLDEDDDWFLDIVWTDMNNPDETDFVKRSGLKYLRKVGSGSTGYIYVLPGDKAGNVLVELRSGKKHRNPTLWSWHIWILDAYPTTIAVEKYKSNAGDQERMDLMSHIIGAFKPVTSNYDANAWEEFGFLYQWGRKDPFPAYKVYENKDFFNRNGIRYDFLSNTLGSRRNDGEENALDALGVTFSMKESIENPGRIVAHQTFWNSELFPISSVNYFKHKYLFLFPWSSPMPQEPNEEYMQEGDKTVFDPSPYGFRIMNYKQGVNLRYQYYHNLSTPAPGSVYDGYYADVNNVNGFSLFAVNQARTEHHAGMYLLNSLNNKSGWAVGSNSNNLYRRAMGFTVRPVLYSKESPNKEDYKKYLPMK